jgi:hypothetical protein
MYAPMRVLRLADQQVPGMEKLYYYVLKTDRMLLKWLPDAEARISLLRRDGTYNTITNTEVYQFDEVAADCDGDDEEEDSDDDDDCLVRDDDVDIEADEESEADDSVSFDVETQHQ